MIVEPEIESKFDRIDDIASEQIVLGILDLLT